MTMKKFKIFTIISLFGLASCTYDSKEETPTDPCVNSPIISLVSSVNTSCGQAVGAIVVNATGGEGSFDYSIDGVAFQTTGDFNNLAAATYTLTVKDGNSCTDEIEVIIGNDDGASFTLNGNDAGCNTSNGSISVAVVGGAKPYTFKLDNGQFQSDSAFSNLSSGVFEITVRDANGCESSQSIELKSGIDINSVRSIVHTNCAVSGCHSSGSQFPNMDSDAEIKNSAGRIKARSGAQTMPPASSGFSLTQQQIDRIACWVDEGAVI